MAVGSGAYVEMGMACDVEAAELRSRRLCIQGSRAAKEGGDEPLVCQVPGEVCRAGEYSAWT